ncbi:MAG: DUF456 family protein [Gammaproteobacteria bacterium]|nr:DUF456 family protein [Gammaproteobacteria bacterium]
MRNTTIALLATLTASLLTSAPASAAGNASKEETVGVASGAVIGAAAGGPVGFIVGAAIGARIGDIFYQKNNKLQTLETALGESRVTAASLENNLDTLTNEIDRLQAVARPELIALLQAGIDMDLLFRTDESTLLDTTGERLTQLAATLATMPDIRIQLDGFADTRGDEQYNFELSKKRVEFVRGLLIDAGVHPDQVIFSAHGESTARDETLDSYALERRVGVKLFINDTTSVASNPTSL